ATARHIKCVCGNPCSKRTAGPDPKRRRKMPVSFTCNSIASKSSNVVGLVITRPPIERLFLKCRAYPTHRCSLRVLFATVHYHANGTNPQCSGLVCAIVGGSTEGVGSAPLDSERFRSDPRTCRPFCGSLSAR